MAKGRIACARARATLAALAMALLLGGCTLVEVSSSRSGDPGRLTEESMADSWERGLRLLATGDEDMAEAEFVLARESSEFEARARRMLRQIRTPPAAYFPREYFHVELSAGESLSSLADRYLGDPLRFYALARYNAIRVPSDVAVGQQIRIPLTEDAARVRRAETGAADTDDPVTDAQPAPQAAEAAEPEPAAATETEPAAGEAAAPEPAAPATADGEAAPAAEPETPGPAERQQRIARHYREATLAFQRQDLDATIRHCQQVLELDPDHANCRLYRARARELKRRLDDIPASG